jgi:HTH-type transcriptional regulator / antitoxin HigA
LEPSLQEQKIINATSYNNNAIAPAWNAFQNALPIKIRLIHSAQEYDRVVNSMNDLLDTVGDDEDHELADLLALVGQLVEDYDQDQYAVPDAPPHEVRRFLLDQHDLKQTDLAVDIGGQFVVSAILSGKREINARQAKALAVRFGVSASAFI